MTASSSLREYVRDELKKHVPAKWRIIPVQRIPDQITDVTVIIKHTRIERLKAAPLGKLENSLVVTIVTPHADIERAEDELDDAVIDLLGALDGHPGLGWSSAEKVSVDEVYLGWDINMTAITERK